MKNKGGTMKRLNREEFYHMMHPKPTFIISTSYEGRRNACTCSWATPVSEEPPLLLICLSKTTFTGELIKKGREFVVNIPQSEHLHLVWKCGRLSGREEDKSKSIGFEYEDSVEVKAPRIKGMAGYIECTVRDVHDGGECDIIVGEVKLAEVNTKLYSKGWKGEIPLLHIWGREFALPGKRIKP